MPQNPRRVSEVPHFRDGLLTQEAAFRQVDRLLEPGLGRQGIRPEVRPHADIPTADPPGLEVLLGHLDQSPCTEAIPEPPRRLAPGHDHIAPRAEHRRGHDVSSFAVLGGEAAEDGDDQRSFAAVVELNVGGEHVRGEDRVDGLRLSWRLEEQEGAVDPGDVEVGTDAAGRGQEQGSTRLSVGETLDVGRDEVVEPGTGVHTHDGDRAPLGQRGERAPVLEDVLSPRFRTGTPFAGRALANIPALAKICPGQDLPLWEDIGPMEIPRTLVVTNDFPPRVGGIQRTLESLCRALPADNISVIAPSSDGSEAFDEGVGFDITRERRRFIWPSASFADRLDAEVARTGAEVVLFGDAFPLALLGPRLASHGVPNVVLAHGFDYWLSTVPVAHTVMKRMTSHASRVAGCSEFISRRVRTAVPRHVPVSVLRPGADVERFRPDLETADIRENHGLEDRPLVVCVSRLVPRKGQDVLIRSMRAVQRRVPEAGLLIVGSGPHEAKLRGLAERAPTRSVFFVGEVPEQDLPRYYAVGDVFAMPCRTRMAGLEVEGWGNVFIEAAACGRPVVVGDSGGSREALVHGETGLLVDGSDVEGVADALATLLEDPPYARRLGKAGRARVEREHTWPRVAGRLAGWLRDAAADR